MVLVILKSKFTHTVISKEILHCCQNRMILKIKEYPLIRTRQLKKKYIWRSCLWYTLLVETAAVYYIQV